MASSLAIESMDEWHKFFLCFFSVEPAARSCSYFFQNEMVTVECFTISPVQKDEKLQELHILSGTWYDNTANFGLKNGRNASIIMKDATGHLFFDKRPFQLNFSLQKLGVSVETTAAFSPFGSNFSKFSDHRHPIKNPPGCFSGLAMTLDHRSGLNSPHA